MNLKDTTKHHITCIYRMYTLGKVTKTETFQIVCTVSLLHLWFCLHKSGIFQWETIQAKFQQNCGV